MYIGLIAAKFLLYDVYIVLFFKNVFTVENIRILSLTIIHNIGLVWFGLMSPQTDYL